MTNRTERQRIERVVETFHASVADHVVQGRVLGLWEVTMLLRRELAKRDARVRRIVKAERLRTELAAVREELDKAIATERERCACVLEWEAGAVLGTEREELIRVACKLRDGKHAAMLVGEPPALQMEPDYKGLVLQLEQQLADLQGKLIQTQEELSQCRDTLEEFR